MNIYFEQAGVKPSTWVLGNELSGDLRNAFNKDGIVYQLVPPKTHNSNSAERTIQTYKNHLKAGFVSLGTEFS